MTAAVANQVPFSVGTLDAPAFSAFAITPSDTTNMVSMCRGIYVGTAGNIAAIMSDGTGPITFMNCLQGQVLPIIAMRVNNTNTTASNLVALL
jgi:hypothetical protein